MVPNFIALRRTVINAMRMLFCTSNLGKLSEIVQVFYIFGRYQRTPQLTVIRTSAYIYNYICKYKYM